MSIVNIDRPKGDDFEPCEVDLILQETLERVLWRRGDWRNDASKRLVHALALLQGMPMDSFSEAKKTISGGIWTATLEARK